MFRTLPAAEQIRRINELTDAEAEALLHDWSWNGRPEQQIPAGDWITWLILAGRGFGKTRTGAETVRTWVKTNKYVNLIGATADDARDIMVEGESGILAVCPGKMNARFTKKSERQLQWPNGAISLIFTADEPERLRGKQHMKLWGDEYASWRYKEAWDQASLGLRLGVSPQAVITTTPKPTKELRALMSAPSTIVTRGSTYDNRLNLAGAFLTQIVSRYEGTRLGRQELNAEILDDNPGALWRRDWIEEHRIARGPPMKRVVVAIDPTATSNPIGDEARNLTVEGRGTDDRGYVLADLSMRGTPREWATVAVNAYHEWKADRIIGETNNGGEMIQAVIRMVDRNVAYKGIRARRGKITRADPVSALYEQRRGLARRLLPGYGRSDVRLRPQDSESIRQTAWTA